MAILRSTGQPLRRAHLTEQIGVTPASMGAALNKLAAQGIVAVEHGVADGVGRPSPSIRLLAEAAQTMTISLGPDGAAHVAVHDLAETRGVIGRTPPVSDAYETISNVVDAIHEAGADHERLVGVGVAVGERVGHTPTADLIDDLRAKLGAATGGVPVVFAEHTALAAVATARGRPDGTLTMYLHSCSHGHISGGLAVAGEPFRLVDLRFDVAHMLLRVGGRRCRCGRRGCVAAEIYTSEAGAGRASNEIDVDGLALTIDTLSRLVRPAVVVLGGRLAAHAAPAHELLASLRTEGVTPPPVVTDLTIERAPWNDDRAVHIGAAELALGDFLLEPAFRGA